MTDGCVLDASAILCLLFREPGAERVEERLAGSRVSAVNYAEVVAKLVDRGVAADVIREALTALDLDVVPLDQATAEAAGLLRIEARSKGLSLGDRCCLALAKADRLDALTTDRAWTSLDIGVAVVAVR